MVPTEIKSILEKIEKKQKPTSTEKEKLRTYLGTLTTSEINPANPAKELNNPFPMEVDVSLNRPLCLEDRVRRIMSLSAKVAQSQGFETPEEADDFEVTDEFDVMPKSPFEMVDHYAPMQPEQPVAEEPLATSSEAEAPSNPEVNPETSTTDGS